ncbi:pentapeptide repeat-containing protein [Geitlerinema sp. PCC 7407]|uniref:pentapeptide repeat-containing protein n=1 Tax=Geitlerinema sp. PCC 7407 TaxID=1173025 RepID=UPI00029F92B1|nr:pentapeptide repeat-containing protein [Geitlerinema sp. PCC 7407]AFY66464.1 pentapeptide repeat protein [Geitlerinema sp. PCC 7407]
MSSNFHGRSIKKPVSIWKRDLGVDLKDLFKSLTKFLIDGGTQNWSALAKDLVDIAASVRVKLSFEQVARLLIFRSLQRAIVKLIQDNHGFIKVPLNLTDKELSKLYERLDHLLETTEVKITLNFLEEPKNLSILPQIQSSLSEWLKVFGADPVQAQLISARLPGTFVIALDEEWRDRSRDYEVLFSNDTPFTKGAVQEEAWQQYKTWLQKQVEEPIFLGAFGLKQVYVPLKAYYNCKARTASNKESRYNNSTDKLQEKQVVDLSQEIHAWLEKPNIEDTIRVICGGLGSGKSSFTKMLAADLAEKTHLLVLWVPLHKLVLETSLRNAINSWAKIYHKIVPLKSPEDHESQQRLLIIFDGLDEFSMSGKVSSEATQQFMHAVQELVSPFNQNEARLQVLISGRDLVIQTIIKKVRHKEKVLYLLPYFVPEEQRKEYKDNNGHLSEDQRHTWWRKYGELNGQEYTGLPRELDRYNLIELTAQPLLNYLLALTYERKRLVFSRAVDLNIIYDNLLEDVYERQWADKQGHYTLDDLHLEEFIYILEEVALAIWHDQDRGAATTEKIKIYCERSGLKKPLEIFQQEAEAGVIRLLTAFYFREGNNTLGKEKIFEFTHKSFGEYLTARRIVRGIGEIASKLAQHQQNKNKGWGEKEALIYWATLCGPSDIDFYLLEFIRNEIRRHPEESVANWQQSLTKLFEVMLKYGMPMECLTPRPDCYAEEARQAQNSEVALLAVLNACARYTQEIVNIEWTSEVFGTWLGRVQGQVMNRHFKERSLVLQCLGFLNLKNCILVCRNLDGSNLVRTNLAEADLAGASLFGADLEGANLEQANLHEANLAEAALFDANLSKATLVAARLEGAGLEGANLKEARLFCANLVGANLERANLEGADLGNVDLTAANLIKANLQGVNIEHANFSSVRWTGETSWQGVQGLETVKGMSIDLQKHLGIQTD